MSPVQIPDQQKPATHDINAAYASDEPVVSVIMASYNYARYIAYAIESVRSQTYGDWELLVIDDGSADASRSIIKGFADADARIRLLTHERNSNRGLPETIRVGLGRARGKFIAFLESDDLWKPDCLEKRLARIAGTEAGAVFNHVELLEMPGADSAAYHILMNAPLAAYGELRGSFSPEKALLTKNIVPTFSCIMIQRQALMECDFSAPVPRWLDWWLWLQLAGKVKFAYLPEPLSIWRVHTASYNSKVSLKQYLRDAAAMWEGFRRLYRGTCQSGTYTRFPNSLRLPFWTRLFFRAYDIFKNYGISGLARRVRGRIRS